MTACACNWPLNMNVMLRKLYLVETATIFLTKSRILKNVTTFESDTQLFLKGLDMYKITRKLVLMKWTLTPPQSLHYQISSKPVVCSPLALCLCRRDKMYIFSFFWGSSIHSGIPNKIMCPCRLQLVLWTAHTCTTVE